MQLRQDLVAGGLELLDRADELVAPPGEGTGERNSPTLLNVAQHRWFFHDGRADTIRDAIEMHDGEGLAAANAFRGLSTTEQEDLLRFLETR